MSDRIRLTWAASRPEVGQALRGNASLVADEVLATEITEADPGADAFSDAEAGFSFAVERIG